MSTSSRPLTRRSLLAWSGAGTLGLTISTGASAPSRAAATQRLTVTGSASAFPTFSGDFRQRFANVLPNAVELVSPVPLGCGTIRVDFDPHLLALSDGAAQLVADDGVTSTPMSVDGGSVTVPVPEHVRASRVVVALPFFPTVSYPTENTGASTDPKAHVTIQGQVTDGDFRLTYRVHKDSFIHWAAILAFVSFNNFPNDSQLEELATAAARRFHETSIR